MTVLLVCVDLCVHLLSMLMKHEFQLEMFVAICWSNGHHHYHVALVARISLSLSRHSSLSFIALGRSSGQHPVSSHSCWMYVRASRPAFARPCVGVHKSTSLMSSSLLLLHCWRSNGKWCILMIRGTFPLLDHSVIKVWILAMPQKLTPSFVKIFFSGFTVMTYMSNFDIVCLFLFGRKQNQNIFWSFNYDCPSTLS